MLQLAAQVLYLKLADTILLLFLFHLLGEPLELLLCLSDLFIHLSLFLLLLGLLLFQHSCQLLLPLLQLLHLLLPVCLEINGLCSGRLLLPLPNLLFILSILILVRRSRSFLVLSGHLVTLFLLLQLAHLLFPDAQLIEQNGGFGVRCDTTCGRLHLFLLLQIARYLLRMLLLLDSQLLDALLKLLLCLLALFEFVLHVTESLGTAHRIDLFLKGQYFFFLLVNLLVDAGELVLLKLDLVLRVLLLTYSLNPG